MSGGIILTVFHLIAVVQFTFGLYYVVNIFKLPNTKEHEMFNQFGGPYRFLTNWDVFIQALFYTVCLLNDLFGSNEVTPKKTPILRKIKDFMHASIGFPLAAFVTLTFWGLMAVDRELVFPKSLDPYFPTWLNHILHTNIFIFTVVELFASFRVYPSRKKGLTALTTLMLVYLFWTLFLFAKTGRWVYPVMEVLNWPLKIVFMVSLMAFTHVLYFAGEFINKLIWRKELKLVGTSKKSTKAKAR